MAVHLQTYIPMVRGSELGKDVGYITGVCCFSFFFPFDLLSKTTAAAQLSCRFFLARRLRVRQWP